MDPFSQLIAGTVCTYPGFHSVHVVSTYRILCVDPDDTDREETAQRVRSDLDELGPVVETAASVADAEAALTPETAAVVTEYELPDGTGFDLIRRAEEICPDAGIVLYTDTDPETMDTSELRGALTEYVGKESVFGTDRLTQLIRTTVESRVQASYPLPQNETERLAALQSYDLDAPGLATSLNRVTDLAAEHFDVEIASINIIKEHSQDPMACYGAVQEWESVDREDSICTFTIVEDDDVMTVEDVTEDPRFVSRSEELLDLGVQAYMGANLVTEAGLVIGPLCIYDDRPREFTAADEAYLKDLAALAMDLIELHNRVEGEASEGWQR